MADLPFTQLEREYWQRHSGLTGVHSLLEHIRYAIEGGLGPTPPKNADKIELLKFFVLAELAASAINPSVKTTNSLYDLWCELNRVVGLNITKKTLTELQRDWYRSNLF